MSEFFVQSNDEIVFVVSSSTERVVNVTVQGTEEIATALTSPVGINGTDGVGVPTGGSAGQVLTKASATDYDTEWTTPLNEEDMIRIALIFG